MTDRDNNLGSGEDKIEEQDGGLSGSGSDKESGELGGSGTSGDELGGSGEVGKSGSESGSESGQSDGSISRPDGNSDISESNR